MKIENIVKSELSNLSEQRDRKVIDIKNILKLELADPIEKRDRKIIAFLEEHNVPWRYCGYESYASGKVRQFLHTNVLSLLRYIIYTHYLEKDSDILVTISDTLVEFVYLSTNTYEQNNRSQAIQLDSQVLTSELKQDREVELLLSFTMTIETQPKLLEYTIALLLGLCVKKMLYLADCIEKEGKTQQADLIRASLYPNQFAELESEQINCSIGKLPSLKNKNYLGLNAGLIEIDAIHEIVEGLYSKNGEIEYINQKTIIDGNLIETIPNLLTGISSKIKISELDPKVVFPQMIGILIAWKDGFGLLSPIINPLAEIPIIGIPFELLDTDMLGRTLATFVFAYFLPRNNPIRSLFWGEDKLIIGITAGLILTSVLLV